MRQCVLHSANPWTLPSSPANWQPKCKTGSPFFLKTVSHRWTRQRQHVHHKWVSDLLLKNLNNDRPIVPGEIIAARQPCVSLLEVVRMWLRQWHDLREEEETALNTTRLTDCENIGNETLSGCLPSSRHYTESLTMSVIALTNTIRNKNKHRSQDLFFFCSHLLHFVFLADLI